MAQDPSQLPPSSSQSLGYAQPTVPPPSATLGARAARGALWVTAPAVLAKLLGFLADIALAWFLTPREFGLVGLAVAVAALFGTIQQAGLRDILTQRQRRFARWSTPGFWLAAMLGLACSGLMALSALPAARIFGAPELRGLVLLMSCRCFLDALAIVPQAKLQIELRYRAIGGVAALCMLIQALLSVVLASQWFGWGPYAMCVPMVLTSAVQAALFWILARPALHARLQVRRWRWLGRDAGFAMATGLVTIAVGYGDNAVLGLFQNQEVVGVYFFAYRLAVQANQLLVGNLISVIFSALSQLGRDRQRQVRAALSAAKMLAIIAVPVNLLQAAAAEPLISLIYPARWQAAIVPFQLLSVGMALAFIGAPATSLIRAQGRFGTFFFWSAGISLAYLLMIGVGAWLAEASGVALAVAIYYGIFGPAGLRVAVGRLPGFWRNVLVTFYVPLLLGILACLGAYSSRFLFGAVEASHLASLLWIVVTALLLYCLMIRIVLPSRWQELIVRLRSLRRQTHA
ncbi:MAG: oligosaccharide flippase family protein [Phycisphaerae bacterium]|nr:oligosaccharide flippase family protein [Phycisphaerae bacterium]